MKKTSKFLSMILALVMAFALAVPAFADDDLVEVTFSVNPIGTATIHYGGGASGYESDSVTTTAYVFDRDVIVARTDEGNFTTVSMRFLFTQLEMEERGSRHTESELGGFEELGGELESNGAQQFTMDREGICCFTAWCYLGPYYENPTVGASEGSDPGIWDIKKTPYMITKTYMDDLIARGFEVDFQPSAPAAKPAPGVAVALNDGTGEFAYTIKYGDSLSRIAAYYYGDMNVYKLIFERNKDTLKNANTIYAGQTIILPSYAAVAEFKAAAK